MNYGSTRHRTLHQGMTRLGVLLALASMCGAAWAQSPSQRQAQEYAQQHGFSVKQIAAGTDARRVTRMFVPVTQQTYCSFLERFSDGKGYCHLNFNNGNNHLAMGLKPPVNNQATDCYLWARNYNGSVANIGDYRNMYMAFNAGGYIIPVNLAAQKVQHLTQWLAARNAPQDNLYRGGNCMEWLPNAEVAPGRALFHEMGIRRSKDGRNMKAKILHGALGGAVDVVGVFVQAADQFNQMTEQQLLGPPPAGGIADALR